MQLNSIFNEIGYRTTLKRMDLFEKEMRNESITREKEEINYNFGEYNDIIKEFVTGFKKEFSEEETNKMIHRLNSLSIKERWNDFNKTLYHIALGYYDSEKNTIMIEKYRGQDFVEDTKETLMHELFHMASTKKVGDYSVTGFEIPGEIGLTLNEGYTDLIAKRTFSNDKEMNINEFLVLGIENIVGKEELKQYFINADLKGLIKELSNYSSREEVIKLLYAMDHYDHVFYNPRLYRSIVQEIAKMNAEKLYHDYDSGLISKEEFDISYIKKVSEYKRFRYWDENARIISNNDEIMLKDDHQISATYMATNEKPLTKKL
ncbi:MAG: hypothetical protein IJG68_02295 [Bacilli bacterium]|nr:hypothetical protein [Bacilli bacterium]